MRRASASWRQRRLLCCDGLTGGFIGENFLLIRFHGMYQQDDRDIRAERATQKLEPRHAMLLRCRLPGGVITTTQWKAI
ncbi:hypothetical protein FK513_27945, partial [Klebsiella pneumoniae]|nr:hypothetical protein [Klebsiella pneumoniae]